MAFFLTTEPWIPCLTLAGGKVELGLRDTLARAHELRGVHDASPLVTLTLHRLLLAVLHRVFGPRDLDAYIGLCERGSFDAAKLDAYFGDHRARFDLLDRDRPFYQTRGLPREYEPDGLSRLVLERSQYGAPVDVFEHRSSAWSAVEVLPLAAAARSLLVLHACAPGGLVRKPGEPGSATAGPMNRGAYVLVEGDTLFETLLSNLLEYAPGEGLPFAGDAALDVPSWEQDALPRPVGDKEPRRRPHGWVDLLTWQSRRLELAVSPDGAGVTGVTYCIGRGLDMAGLCEPMLAYRTDDKWGLVPIDVSETRALFRDCHSLLRSAGADGARAPLAVLQASRRELRHVRGRAPLLRLAVYGMKGDRAVIKLTRAERLAVPAAVAESEERVAKVFELAQMMEEGAQQLRYAVRVAVEDALAPGDREPHKDDVSKVASHLGAEAAFWAAIAGPFQAAFAGLAVDAPDVTASFSAAVTRRATEALREACAALGTSARQLQGGARAEARLRASLLKLVPTPGGPS